MSRAALQTGAGKANNDTPKPLRRTTGGPILPTDSVRAYLQQIGHAGLLDAAEEVDLAQRIEVGLYATERLRIADPPTPPTTRPAGRCVAI